MSEGSSARHLLRLPGAIAEQGGSGASRTRLHGSGIAVQLWPLHRGRRSRASQVGSGSPGAHGGGEGGKGGGGEGGKGGNAEAALNLQAKDIASKALASAEP